MPARLRRWVLVLWSTAVALPGCTVHGSGSMRLWYHDACNGGNGVCVPVQLRSVPVTVGGAGGKCVCVCGCVGIAGSLSLNCALGPCVLMQSCACMHGRSVPTTLVAGAVRGCMIGCITITIVVG